MGPALGFLIIAFGSVVAAAAFIWLIVRISEHQPRKGVLDKRDEELYHRAAKIMGRMVHLQDLPSEEDGIDILSAKTSKQVTEWLADYRREINKK